MKHGLDGRLARSWINPGRKERPFDGLVVRRTGLEQRQERVEAALGQSCR